MPGADIIQKISNFFFELAGILSLDRVRRFTRCVSCEVKRNKLNPNRDNTYLFHRPSTANKMVHLSPGERLYLCVIGRRRPTPIAFFEMISVGGNC